MPNDRLEMFDDYMKMIDGFYDRSWNGTRGGRRSIWRQLEYLGLSEINGPLVVLEGVQNAAYDEIVEMTVAGNLHKIDASLRYGWDKAIIQVFEGTDGMALRNTIQGCLRAILWR